jgi:hypothetical protein
LNANFQSLSEIVEYKNIIDIKIRQSIFVKMSESVWNNHQNTEDNQINPGNAVSNKQHALQFSNIHRKEKSAIVTLTSNKNDTVSASNGFSEGIKRQLASIEAKKVSEKNNMISALSNQQKLTPCWRCQ